MSQENRDGIDVNGRWRAQEIAEVRYAFRQHLLIYTMINGGLVALWYLLGAGFPWPIYSIIFWGIGLGSHYLRAYGRYPTDWIENETDRILRQEKGY